MRIVEFCSRVSMPLGPRPCNRKPFSLPICRTNLCQHCPLYRIWSSYNAINFILIYSLGLWSQPGIRLEGVFRANFTIGFVKCFLQNVIRIFIGTII